MNGNDNTYAETSQWHITENKKKLIYYYFSKRYLFPQTQDKYHCIHTKLKKVQKDLMYSMKTIVNNSDLYSGSFSK
jgi:hypothetical protein